MIIIYIFIGILTVCSILIGMTNYRSDVNIFSKAVLIITSFIFTFLLISIAVNRLDCKNEMVKIQSLRETVEIARKQEVIERAVLTTKIADANK